MKTEEVAVATGDEVNETAGMTLGRMGGFLGFRLKRVQNQLSKDFASATQKYNLRSGLFSSLAMISANPGISQNDLSHEVGLDKSVTVQIIDELEKRGFARRQRSTVDRRRHELICTSEGEDFLDTLFGILAKTEAKALDQVTDEEFATLKRILDKIYRVL